MTDSRNILTHIEHINGITIKSVILHRCQSLSYFFGGAAPMSANKSLLTPCCGCWGG